MRAFKKQKVIVLAIGSIIILATAIVKYVLTTNFTTDNLLFLRTYKYLSDDSYQWLSDGIRLFENVRLAWRNPGLVLIVKFLSSLHLLSLLPLLNQLTFAGIILVCGLIGYRLSRSKLAMLFIWITMYVDYSLQIFANYILADYYAIFFVALATLLLLYRKNRLSLFLLGISCLFQNFAFFLLPVWLIYIYREDLLKLGQKGSLLMRLRKLPVMSVLIDLIVFLNINLVWFAYKFVLFHNPFYSNVQQFNLISPHLNSQGIYLINIYSLIGPLAFLALLFVVIKWKHLSQEFKLIIAALITTYVFWTMLYNWNDRRFLLYLIPFIFPLIGWALIQIKNNFVKIILLVILIYPTTISLGQFFNIQTLPITNFYQLSFASHITENYNIYLDPAVTLVKTDSSWKRSLLPFLADAYIFRGYNKQDQNTTFTRIETQLKSIKLGHANCIENLPPGLVNSVDLILYNEILQPDVRFAAKC